MLIAGALLRALLIVFPRSLDDDADVYRELGMNLFQHGIYGIAYDSVISPGLFRLPGYPIFLALHGGQGRSKTIPVWRSKSRPVGML
jgi:hypothetical protein